MACNFPAFLGNTNLPVHHQEDMRSHNRLTLSSKERVGKCILMNSWSWIWTHVLFRWCFIYRSHKCLWWCPFFRHIFFKTANLHFKTTMIVQCMTKIYLSRCRSHVSLDKFTEKLNKQMLRGAKGASRPNCLIGSTYIITDKHMYIRTDGQTNQKGSIQVLMNQN